MKPLWEDRKIIVCAGTGGVGKTTVSASIAVAAAASGLNTIVMTIDPARRLANALGLDDFGNVEREIGPDMLKPYGVELKAPLHVMMLDVKQTFDTMINNMASSPEARDLILRNKIYQQFSTVLAGALEYAAVEMLYDVYASGRYDLIVLDTPPSQNAIDFLEAPSKMINFIEQSSNQWFLKPSAMAGKLGLKLLDVGASIISKTLGKMAGGETIKELSQFLVAFSDLYDGFQKRYEAVRTLMASSEVGFILVTSTQANQRAAMRRFQNDLGAAGFKTRGVVVNRIRQVNYPLQEVLEQLNQIKPALSAEQISELSRALEEEAYLAQQDQKGLNDLEHEVSQIPIIKLPELRLDAHDLDSLSRLHGAFLDSTSPPG